jgi:hypothetical protein
MGKGIRKGHERMGEGWERRLTVGDRSANDAGLAGLSANLLGWKMLLLEINKGESSWDWGFLTKRANGRSTRCRARKGENDGDDLGRHHGDFLS